MREQRNDDATRDRNHDLLSALGRWIERKRSRAERRAQAAKTEPVGS